jgi:hypothetical protein
MLCSESVARHVSHPGYTRVRTNTSTDGLGNSNTSNKHIPVGGRSNGHGHGTGTGNGYRSKKAEDKFLSDLYGNHGDNDDEDDSDDSDDDIGGDYNDRQNGHHRKEVEQRGGGRNRKDSSSAANIDEDGHSKIATPEERQERLRTFGKNPGGRSDKDAPDFQSASTLLDGKSRMDNSKKPLESILKTPSRSQSITKQERREGDLNEECEGKEVRWVKLLYIVSSTNIRLD